MKLRTLASVFAFVSYSVLCGQSALVSAPSKEWTALQGTYDYLDDQQTGLPESDIVGQGVDYGLFVTHNEFGAESSTDGTFGFRIRLDGAGGNKNDTKYTRAAWLGIDADLNDSIDVFIGVNFSGSKQELGIFAAGQGKNDTPGSTSVNTDAPYKTYLVGPDNYNYRPVDYLSDGGTTNDLNPDKKPEPDYYLSVLVDFTDIVSYLAGNGIAVTDKSPMRFVSATSTQGNTLNQDIGGVRGGEDSDISWSGTGGLTQTVTANGISVVPEPSVLLLTAVAGIAWTSRRSRQ